MPSDLDFSQQAGREAWQLSGSRVHFLLHLISRIEEVDVVASIPLARLFLHRQVFFIFDVLRQHGLLPLILDADVVESNYKMRSGVNLEQTRTSNGCHS